MIEEYAYDSSGHQAGVLQPGTGVKRMELYASGRHLATYDIASNATYFIHGDWQGTERLRTSYSGAAVETCTNLPFGDNQQCTGTDISPMHFTGKPRDTETNLDYFGARYYSSGMARWMSPDWAAKPASVPYANFGDPQSLNLYAYVGNNPASKEDADGHMITKDQTWGTGSKEEEMSSTSLGSEDNLGETPNPPKPQQPPPTSPTTAPSANADPQTTGQTTGQTSAQQQTKPAAKKANNKQQQHTVTKTPEEKKTGSGSKKPPAPNKPSPFPPDAKVQFKRTATSKEWWNAVKECLASPDPLPTKGMNSPPTDSTSAPDGPSPRMNNAAAGAGMFTDFSNCVDQKTGGLWWP